MVMKQNIPTPSHGYIASCPGRKFISPSLVIDGLLMAERQFSLSSAPQYCINLIMTTSEGMCFVASKEAQIFEVGGRLELSRRSCRCHLGTFRVQLKDSFSPTRYTVRCVTLLS